MGKHRILLVDDEHEIRDFLTVLGQDKNLEFTHASNGEEGLRFILQENFDCIVSDIKMPLLSGFEMLKAARAQGQDVPMVFISAFATEEIEHEVVNYGAVKLLHKLELHKVNELIQEAIGLGHDLKLMRQSNDQMGEDFIHLMNHSKTGQKK
jgi:DNA-binding response OmpR family regulator